MRAETPPPIEPSRPSLTPPSNQGISEHTWCLIAHLCGFVGYLGNGIGSVIAPLIVYLIKKDYSPLIASHAKEVLNFNISVTIYGLCLFAFILVTLGFGALLAAPAGLALFVFHLVCTIKGSIKANEGILYRYPLTLRLVK